MAPVIVSPVTSRLVDRSVAEVAMGVFRMNHPRHLSHPEAPAIAADYFARHFAGEAGDKEIDQLSRGLLSDLMTNEGIERFYQDLQNTAQSLERVMGRPGASAEPTRKARTL